MIIGYHLLWTAYGHWFPNDPRGSWSQRLWKRSLATVRGLDADPRPTRALPVPRASLRQFMNDARSAMKWPSVTLSSAEVETVGQAIAEAVRAMRLVVHACAILPNHVHMIMDRHVDSYERIANRLKGVSAQRVREHRGIPVAQSRRERAPVWTSGYWCGYIDNPADMESAIEYVRDNLNRENLPLQRWPFVLEFAGGGARV